MSQIGSICVFCGSRMGRDPSFAEAARLTGRLIAERGWQLVYGGGQVGLMGILADAALSKGGKVVGVIPEPLAREEVAHQGLSELHVVPDMHRRKALMNARSDAFLVLPGGIGTYEEFFEILSWATLGLHHKPLGVVNILGYYDPLAHLLRHAVVEGFARPELLDFLAVADEPEHVLNELTRLPARQVRRPLLQPDQT